MHAVTDILFQLPEMNKSEQNAAFARVGTVWVNVNDIRTFECSQTSEPHLW